jgi:hypothetical protein
MGLQNLFGMMIIRDVSQAVLQYHSGVEHYDGCFFQHVGTPGSAAYATELMPQLNIVDFCETFDLDSNGDIMPEIYPSASGHFQIDSNGDSLK